MHPLILVKGKAKGVDLAVNAPRFRGRFVVERWYKGVICTGRWEFDNLITDTALDQMATNSIGNNTGSQAINYAGVGTGSTAPSNSDTALQSELSSPSTNRTNANGGVTPTDTYTSGPPDYWEHVTTFLFDFSQSNGNLTEIGIFDANTSGHMFCRQLFKDGGGTPVTVTKTSDDQLKVIYKLRAYPPTSDVTGSITISGDSYDYTIRALGASGGSGWGDMCGNGALWANQEEEAKYIAWSGSIAARTDTSPTGSNASCDTDTVASYTPGDKFRQHTLVWSAGSANFGGSGIQTVEVFPTRFSHGMMQIGFSPGLPKDNTMQLTLVIQNSWDRM
jgi:hypothetical protein